MLKSMVVILAMFGSVSAQAGSFNIFAVQDHKAVGAIFIGTDAAVQDQKAVGAMFVATFDAVQDQKAVGIGGNDYHNGAVQDTKAVSVESQVETAKLLDLNVGF